MVWQDGALVRAVWWLNRNVSAARVNVCARALKQHVSIETPGKSNGLASLRRGFRRKGKHLSRAFLILLLHPYGKPHWRGLADSDMRACVQGGSLRLAQFCFPWLITKMNPHRNPTGCCRYKVAACGSGSILQSATDPKSRFCPFSYFHQQS